MRRFARLCWELAATTSASRKVETLTAYFRSVPEDDAALALAYLLGRRGRRPVTTTSLRQWACEEAGIPLWLFDASYDAVGDLGETLALVLIDTPESAAEPPRLTAFVAESVTALAKAAPAEARAIVTGTWRRLTSDERFIYHKLIGGAFRMGVAHGLVVRAVAQVTGLDSATITHRLMGGVEATAATWRALGARDERDALPTRPYPFCLATQLEITGDEATLNEQLGPVSDWLVEWKFDGIRCQLLHRGEAVAVVSRGEERIDASFPELVALAKRLPSGTAIDGEVLLVERELGGATTRILPFHRLQSRLNAKRAAWTVEPGLFELERIAFVAYDLLESEGTDRRSLPLADRRQRLDALVASVSDDRLHASPTLCPTSWEDAARERARSRALGVEGLMLKRRDAAYGSGRERRSAWWKWKIDPFTVDVVLTAAQPGTGRRANLLTDYTFGIWRGNELVPIAKAYSGLTDEEITLVDRQVRATTTAKRGPLRIVEPTLVFELGFEGIERSTRHKAGLALRFPRMLRWRQDKRPADADRIETLESLLAVARASEPFTLDS